MATIQISKGDGSVLDWKISDEQADLIILMLVVKPKRTYSRENSHNWKPRGPKPKIALDGELMGQALKLRGDGMSKEAIARELKLPSRSLGRAFDRYDQHH